MSNDIERGTARSQQGGAEPVVSWSKQKPTKPGRYVVRGFNDAGDEALVSVAWYDGELACNLHDSNSDPVSSYGFLLSEISDKFEWLELYTHPPTAIAGGVPSRDDLIQCLLATQGQSEGVTADAILSTLAAAPSPEQGQAAPGSRWTDGLPPDGELCQVRVAKHLYGSWRKCRVIAIRGDEAWLWLDGNDSTNIYPTRRYSFRPNPPAEDE